MTRDDIKKILGENASEEQITNLLDSFHRANATDKKTIADLNSKLNMVSDYDAIKNKLTEIEQANMTREEQIALREKQSKEKLEKASMILNTTKAKEILAGLNLDDETISLLVSADESKTIANATRLKNQLDIMHENTVKETKESLSNADLKPNITNVNQGENIMTFEKFAKLSATEQEKFINEHPDEFEKL